MRLEQVPMPQAVAARPRDQRGYPVPTITPWREGLPQFAELSVQRMFLCAVQGRCTVCGLPLGDELVWRVVDDENAELIAAALDSGTPLLNAAPVFEGPAHLICALYSAAVPVPWRTDRPPRSNCRNSQRARRAEGEARGTGAAVAAFGDCSAELAHGALAFSHEQPVDMIAYQRGEDLLEILSAELRDEPDDAPRAPA